LAEEEIAALQRLSLIDLKAPFLLYANCSIEYDGRANSKLKPGNYLVIHKNDGSLLIHGGDKTTAKNYQSSGAVLELAANAVVSRRRNETIKVIISEILFYKALDNWSEHNIAIVKTESDLVNKLVANIDDYLGIEVEKVIREYTTDLGKVDVCAIGKDGKLHLIEVKRIKATKNHCNQLRKYMDCVDNSLGYLASPEIGESTLKFMNEKGYKWIQVTFDQ